MTGALTDSYKHYPFNTVAYDLPIKAGCGVLSGFHAHLNSSDAFSSVL
jgi:carbon starvation protein CstA